MQYLLVLVQPVICEVLHVLLFHSIVELCSFYTFKPSCFPQTVCNQNTIYRIRDTIKSLGSHFMSMYCIKVIECTILVMLTCVYSLSLSEDILHNPACESLSSMQSPDMLVPRVLYLSMSQMNFSLIALLRYKTPYVFWLGTFLNPPKSISALLETCPYLSYLALMACTSCHVVIVPI